MCVQPDQSEIVMPINGLCMTTNGYFCENKFIRANKLGEFTDCNVWEKIQHEISPATIS